MPPARTCRAGCQCARRADGGLTAMAPDWPRIAQPQPKRDEQRTRKRRRYAVWLGMSASLLALAAVLQAVVFTSKSGTHTSVGETKARLEKLFELYKQYAGQKG